jgi:hypothetical protein
VAERYCGRCKNRRVLRPIGLSVEPVPCPNCTGEQPAGKSPPLSRPKPDAPMKRGAAISPATPAQRAKVKGMCCIVCGRDSYRLPIHPAHLIDRSLCPEGADDELAVVPLCVACHRLYDDGELSLLEHLEPRWREELAFAVRRFGLISTLKRVTNERWAPEAERRAA